jgi:putative molybdopterin biosynthesis protein
VTHPEKLESKHVELLDAVRRAARQEQFLEVVSAEEARERFALTLDLRPLDAEKKLLQPALGRVLASDIMAPVDVPPFDRSSVDGFAVRAVDTVGASDATARRLLLNSEVLACGVEPKLAVKPNTATAIATGGVVPRGADSIVMIEWTESIEAKEGPVIDLIRTVLPGQFISFAGSDIARGEILLRKGTMLGSREIGMLAACGIADVMVVRRPRVAVLSTGDELVMPGEKLRPAAVYDSNGAIIAAAITEAGGEPVPFGAFPDDEIQLETAVRRALTECDIVVLSGGTSKGAGDLSHRIIPRLGKPGIIVHGVALKPGKPLCLAVVDKKPVAVLPGFPTSAIFTFHAFVAPVIRKLAGLLPESVDTVEATIPVRVPSELGRKEFVLVSLIEGKDGAIAFPSNKSSGAVTGFSEADGFVEVDALAPVIDAGAHMKVTLIGKATRLPDLVIIGSHCVALDVVLSRLVELGFRARKIALGSQGGVTAARRGECDLAPVHLVDPDSGVYNKHLLVPGLSLVAGWQRMQGFVYRPNDERFKNKTAEEALKAALSNPACIMVNRNAGAGTRILIDRLLVDAKPVGYSNQPRSHNAVAAAVSQGRADWGIAIEQVAKLYGLGFLPITPEQYDFLLVEARRDRPAVRSFLTTLRQPEMQKRISALGMRLVST